MPDFHIAAPDKVIQIVKTFSQLTWPLCVEATDSIAHELSWTRHDNPRRIDVTTDLGVSHAYATFLNADGFILEIECFACDFIDEAADRSSVQAAYQTVKATVVAALGKTRGSRGGDSWWELSSGGRIHVKKLTRVVAIQLLSKQYADIERGEARLGISPDRVLGQSK